MMIKKFLASSLILSGATLSLQAHALEIIGTKEAKATETVALPGRLAKQDRPVSLMRVKLSAQEMAALKKQKRAPKNITFAKSPLPSRAALNFDKFPVLDQGRHGACVTFASVAAFNYLLDKPDHISSLCSLALGKTLADNGYYPSGWDGTLGPKVLDQFMRFGYVTTSQQTKNGCAGVKDYPANNEYDTGNSMSLTAYKQFSKSLIWEPLTVDSGARISWIPLVTTEQRFNTEGGDSYDGEKALMQIKQAIANNSADKKNIITIGTLLYGDLCHAGACAKNKADDDTWAVSSSINNMLSIGVAPDSGHEIAIIGYDDNATAIDEKGTTHRGLLTIRNSWSAKHGDKGNYYMTYDYFMQFVMEVQKISREIEK